MKYSLFIGRFQPLHEGHIKLIRKVLSERKKVLIALRDTATTKKNPYTFQQRYQMFYNEFTSEILASRLIVRSIPDISEVCFGRKVGYTIREIRLDEKTEQISATKLRKNDTL